MPKITFMGAGSTVFAKNVLGDSMLTDSLRDSVIALYDIDRARLEESYTMISALNKNINENRAKVEKYLGVENRRAALSGAAFVVDAIQVGGYDPCTITDFEIPKKYGLRQTIADTLGIGGIFRALRTIPVLESFARDMEEVCPDAWFLNYTNHGDADRIYAALYRRQDCRSVPQCAGLFSRAAERSGNTARRTAL
jgi:alpha-galactosidase